MLKDKIKFFKDKVKAAEPLLREAHDWFHNEIEEVERLRFEGNENYPAGYCTFKFVEKNTEVLFVYNLDTENVTAVIHYGSRPLFNEAWTEETKEKLLTKLAQIWT